MTSGADSEKLFDRFAKYYDAIYRARGKDYQKEAEEITRLIAERNPGAVSLLDMGCGTGTHLQYFIERFACTGADPSGAMLALCRERLPDVHLMNAEAATPDLGGDYDAIVCLFAAIAYTQTEKKLGESLQNLGRHLRPGGVLVIDAFISPEDWQAGAINVDLAEVVEGKVIRMSHSTTEDNRAVLKMHFVVGSRGHGIEWFEETHRLGLFAPEHYTEPLRDIGLTVERLKGAAAGRDRFIAVRRRS